MSAEIIVIGNERGGTGKSVLAMQLVSALLAQGSSVASIDLDFRAGTLTRHLEARQRRGLAMPAHETASPGAGEGWLADAIRGLSATAALVVIDTPGATAPLTPLAHARADLLLTPILDDLDGLEALARVEQDAVRLGSPSRYAEMVWDARKRRAAAGARPLDWVVIKNRVKLDTAPPPQMDKLLNGLSKRISFSVRRGLSERPLYEELATAGAGLPDCGGASGPRLTLAHVTARRELRRMVEALGLEPSAAA